MLRIKKPSFQNGRYKFADVQVSCCAVINSFISENKIKHKIHLGTLHYLFSFSVNLNCSEKISFKCKKRIPYRIIHVVSKHLLHK